MTQTINKQINLEHNLLTAEEEIQLGNIIQKTAKIKNGKKVCTTKSKKKQIEREQAIEKLILCNQKLVRKIAIMYQNKGCEVEDLQSEGNIGLYAAAENFDPSKKARFSTYATNRITQKILRYISNNCKIIRTPSHTSEKICKMKRVKESISTYLGREATAREIAEETGESIKKVEKRLNTNHTILSLDAPLTNFQNGEGETTLSEILEDCKTKQPNMIAQQNMDAEVLQKLLLSLSEVEKEVIFNRFGLDGEAPKTLHQIGTKRKVTKERVRQIELKAIEKLRAATKEIFGKNLGNLQKIDLSKTSFKIQVETTPTITTTTTTAPTTLQGMLWE